MDLVKSLTVCCRIPKERESVRAPLAWIRRGALQEVPSRWHPSSGLARSLSHTLIALISSLMACLPVIIAHYLIIWIMPRPLDCKSCEGGLSFFAHFGIPRIFNGVSFKSSQKWPLIQWMSGIEEAVGIRVEKKSSRWRKPLERGPCRNGPLSTLRDFINIRNGKWHQILLLNDWRTCWENLWQVQEYL